MWRLIEYRKGKNSVYFYKIIADNPKQLQQYEFFDELENVVCEIKTNKYRFEIYIKHLLVTNIEYTDSVAEINGVSLEIPELKREVRLSDGRRLLIEEKIYQEIKNNFKVNDDEIEKYYGVYRL